MNNYNFINSGMEVAAFLSDKAASVAVVGKSDVPYKFSLGPDIGRMTMQVRNILWFLFCFFHFTVKVSIYSKPFFLKDVGGEKCEILHE